MELPRALEPWRAWLSLLDAELVEPLGELMLQLQRLLGRVRSAVPRRDDTPSGVGSIARRGAYERLLISEWAYADAEPDEFIRRAGSGELLFTGPEPHEQRRSRLCIALFDAGPAQLGEPRLVQLALLILLARRAEESGVHFQWGVLQAPDKLYPAQGQQAVRQLLAARSLCTVAAPDLAAWEAHLDTLAESLDDCWQIGAASTAALRQASARAALDMPLVEEGVAVALTQQRTTRTACLRMPAPAVGVRVLRNPFPDGAPLLSKPLRHGGPPSLRQPPGFAVGGQWLAVGMADGGVGMYHVPQSVNSPPGKSRREPAPEQGSQIIAAAIFKKSLGQIVDTGASLVLSGFQSALFRAPVEVRKPASTTWTWVQNPSRWLPMYFLSAKTQHYRADRVLLIDRQDRLVCWERTDGRQPPNFSVLAPNVIGAQQLDTVVLYACSVQDGTQIWRLNNSAREATLLMTHAHTALRVLFGGRLWTWADRGGLHALEVGAGQWLLLRPGLSQTIRIGDGASAIGVAHGPAGRAQECGLVVLSADRLSVHLFTGSEQYELMRSREAIAQAVLDQYGQRLCCLLEDSKNLFVRQLHEQRDLLQVMPDA